MKNDPPEPQAPNLDEEIVKEKQKEFVKELNALEEKHGVKVVATINRQSPFATQAQLTFMDLDQFRQMTGQVKQS